MKYKKENLEDFLCAFLIGFSSILIYNLWSLSFDTWYLREDSWVMHKGYLSLTDIMYFFFRRKDDLGYPRPIKDFFFGFPLLFTPNPLSIYRYINFFFFLSNGVLLSYLSYLLFSSRIWAIAIGCAFLMMACHVQPVYWLCAMHTTAGIFFSLLAIILSLETKMQNLLLKRFLILLCFWMAVLSRESQVIIAFLIPLCFWYKQKKILWEIPLFTALVLFYYLLPLYMDGRVTHVIFDTQKILWCIYSYILQFFYSEAEPLPVLKIKIAGIIGIVFLLLTYILSIIGFCKKKSFLCIFYFIGFSAAIGVLAPFYKNIVLEYSTFLGVFVLLSVLIWLEFLKKTVPLFYEKYNIWINLFALLLPLHQFEASYRSVWHLGNFMHKESWALHKVVDELKTTLDSFPDNTVMIIDNIGSLQDELMSYTLVPVFFKIGLYMMYPDKVIFLSNKALPKFLIFPRLDPQEPNNSKNLGNSKTSHWIYSAEHFWLTKN